MGSVIGFGFSWICNSPGNDKADACAVTNNVVELRDNYPWAKLKGTVVDIGGGSGHVSIELAKVSRLMHTRVLHRSLEES